MTSTPKVSLPQRFFKQELLPVLANLQLAIALLLTIAFFSIAGTVIDQDKPITFYQANYPEHPALFGFLTWKRLLNLGLDHVYRTWWYLALLILLGATLTACTFSRQLPALSVARQWKFYEQPRQFQKLALSTELNSGSVESFGLLLAQKRYRVFLDGSRLYARKGLVGRIGPILVHASMLLILLGAIWGAMSGFIAQEAVPSGKTFQISNIITAGPWTGTRLSPDWSVRVNRFWIDYTPTGVIDQFYSDLSVLNPQGQEVKHKIIRVNEPLHYQGVTLYQTDWGIAAVRARINNSPVIMTPMALLNTGGKKRVWGTWIPTKPDSSIGVGAIAQDLQGTLSIYDATSKPLSIVRAGSSIEVNGVNLAIDEIVGTTGLQIKADPGVPLVYAGFGLLMLGVVMSYVSHSQIWALQKHEQLYIGGRTNRAQVTFEREFFALLEQLPKS